MSCRLFRWFLDDPWHPNRNHNQLSRVSKIDIEQVLASSVRTQDVSSELKIYPEQPIISYSALGQRRMALIRLSRLTSMTGRSPFLGSNLVLGTQVSHLAWCDAWVGNLSLHAGIKPSYQAASLEIAQSTMT